MRQAWTQFSFGCACVASALVGVAFAIHGTIRDRIPGLSILFYATPWPVIAAGSALLAIYWTRRELRIPASLFVAITLTALGFWLALDWQWRQTPGPRGQLRIVQWNVDRPAWRLDGDLRWLAAQDADIITIAERHPRRKNTLDRWQAALPDYQLVPSDGEMLCLVRGTVESVEEGSLARRSFRNVIHTRVRDHDVTVVQVDLDGFPPADRSVPLHELALLAGEYRSECLIVLGDFNTPADSAFFLPLRGIATNAFEVAGRGCAATWPVPVPVLSLDQMWTTGRLRAVRCEHFASWRSDHRAVRAEFDFAP